MSYVNVVALDELLSVGGEKGDKLTLVDTLEDQRAEDPVLAFEGEETKFLLAGAINQLPEREKIVVTLYYYEGLTLAEIGQVLGVTESPDLPDAHQGRAAAARQADRPRLSRLARRGRLASAAAGAAALRSTPTSCRGSRYVGPKPFPAPSARSSPQCRHPAGQQ